MIKAIRNRYKQEKRKRPWTLTSASLIMLGCVSGCTGGTQTNVSMNDAEIKGADSCARHKARETCEKAFAENKGMMCAWIVDDRDEQILSKCESK